MGGTRDAGVTWYVNQYADTCPWTRVEWVEGCGFTIGEHIYFFIPSLQTQNFISGPGGHWDLINLSEQRETLQYRLQPPGD